MPTLKITNETPIMLAQLKEELARIKKRDEELNFRAAKTDEYLKLFVGLSGEKAEELFKKIEELNVPRLKPEHIAKIVDLLPASVEELKTLFTSYAVTVSAENLTSIIETAKLYIAENAAHVEATHAAAQAAAAEAAVPAEKTGAAAELSAE